MTNDCQTDVSLTFVDEGLVDTNFCVVHAVNSAQLRESLAAKAGFKISEILRKNGKRKFSVLCPLTKIVTSQVGLCLFNI